MSAALWHRLLTPEPAPTLPVLLVYGDADSIPPAHAAEFFALLDGGLRDAMLGDSPAAAHTGRSPHAGYVTLAPDRYA